jgi:hypothetical protein
VYVGHLRRYRFVLKHLISGTLGKKRSIKKKKDVLSAKGISDS